MGRSKETMFKKPGVFAAGVTLALGLTACGSASERGTANAQSLTSVSATETNLSPNCSRTLDSFDRDPPHDGHEVIVTGQECVNIFSALPTRQITGIMKEDQMTDVLCRLQDGKPAGLKVTNEANDVTGYIELGGTALSLASDQQIPVC